MLEGMLLIGCVERSFPVYVVEKIPGEYEIVILKPTKLEIKLQPVTGKPTWSTPHLSVCRPQGPWSRLAVTSANHSLDIYKWDFRK